MSSTRPPSCRSVSSRCSSSTKGYENLNNEEFSSMAPWLARQRLFEQRMWPEVRERDLRQSMHVRILEIGGDVLNKFGTSRLASKPVTEELDVDAKLQAELTMCKRQLEKVLYKRYQELVKRQESAFRERAATMQKAYLEMEQESVLEVKRKLEKEKLTALDEQEKRLREEFEKRLQEQVQLKVEELEELIKMKADKACKENYENLLRSEKDKFESLLAEKLAMERVDIKDTIDSAVAEERKWQEKRFKQALTVLSMLIEKHDELINQLTAVERDFFELQWDYKRFMDYTDGLFHSDYMMRLREHGAYLANKPHVVKPDYSYTEAVHTFLRDHKLSE